MGKNGGVSNIDSQMDLEWFFNDAMGDLGLESSHQALVNMIQSGVPKVQNATSEAAENKMIKSLEAAKRYKRIATTIRGMPQRAQRFLMLSFERRPWLRQIHGRPQFERYAACSSESVRSFMAERGQRRWTLRAGQEWLAWAEQPPKDCPVEIPVLVALRVAAWTEAERALETALAVYAEANQARRDAEAADKDRRVSKLRRKAA